MQSWNVARMNVIRKLLQYLAIIMQYEFRFWALAYIDNKAFFKEKFSQKWK